MYEMLGIRRSVESHELQDMRMEFTNHWRNSEWKPQHYTTLRRQSSTALNVSAGKYYTTYSHPLSLLPVTLCDSLVSLCFM